MSPTLLILAAGMGSRYGGLKQLDSVGPSGETLLDYSVFDALRAGFGKVVFVIRRDFENEFRERIGRRYEQRIDVDYVFQSLDELPSGYAMPATRTKPLGTGHAIWCACKKVTAPFAAINADDFYGVDAYQSLANFFRESSQTQIIPQFAMVGYELGRTLSEHGSVARGVCSVDSSGHLIGIEECVGLEKTNRGAQQRAGNGAIVEFVGSQTVSMNFWGFTPKVFSMLEEELESFLRNEANHEKAEFYIPVAVANMIANRLAQVSVLRSESSWFGVTYRDDKPLVTESIARLVADGVYPSSLWLEEVAK